MLTNRKIYIKTYHPALLVVGETFAFLSILFILVSAPVLADNNENTARVYSEDGSGDLESLYLRPESGDDWPNAVITNDFEFNSSRSEGWMGDAPQVSFTDAAWYRTNRHMDVTWDRDEDTFSVEYSALLSNVDNITLTNADLIREAIRRLTDDTDDGEDGDGDGGVPGGDGVPQNLTWRNPETISSDIGTFHYDEAAGIEAPHDFIFRREANPCDDLLDNFSSDYSQAEFQRQQQAHLGRCQIVDRIQVSIGGFESMSEEEQQQVEDTDDGGVHHEDVDEIEGNSGDGGGSGNGDDCRTMGVPIMGIRQVCEGSTPGISGGTATAENVIYAYLMIVIRFLSVGLGLVVTLMIVVSGVQYIGSAGDPQKVESAKTKLRHAVEALVLFVLITAVLNFIVPGGIL